MCFYAFQSYTFISTKTSRILKQTITQSETPVCLFTFNLFRIYLGYILSLSRRRARRLCGWQELPATDA